MTLLQFLEKLLIGPLKLVFEIIFSLAYHFSENPGFSIIVLSLVMNILVLPLYRQADAMQEKSRDTDARLRPGIDHIKKTFSGDERMMILQTYYRQNHYRPTDALNGSVSLLLEIPFFMAAYQFLSHAQILNEASFGPISNLALPDGLLILEGLSINVLPILMTAINCVSSAIYLKGFPRKTKIQLYAMALFFLVFLYGSPSGLVFYWTLNNLFSLIKNVFYKLKNPGKVLRLLCCGLGIAVMGYGLFLYPARSVLRVGTLVLLGLALTVPQLAVLLRRRFPARRPVTGNAPVPDRRVFLLGGIFLTLLTGALIPSAVIASSPQEFVDMGYFYHPLWYIAHASTLAAGTFLVWMGVFYYLASDSWKVRFQRLIWVLCGVMLTDYLFFGTNLGTLSARLQYEVTPVFTGWDKLSNLLVILAVCLVLLLLAKKRARVMVPVLLTAAIAVGGMSAVNMVQIRKSVAQGVSGGGYDEDISLPLSKTGKNVVILMLDRALGEYVPYLMHEKPELMAQFDGFTYYPNTISFGSSTNYGSPALFGGYEYTPVEMNKRAEETLASKQNEALKVLPTLFADSGSRVTVCDPPYAGYQWIPDLSIYDDDPRIQAYITKGMFYDAAQKALLTEYNCRNFFLYSIMKSAPLAVQPYLYLDGTYHKAVELSSVDTTQQVLSPSQATGISTNFTDPYNVLVNLPGITTFTEDGQNTFLMLTNDTTHEPMLLQEPDYVPAEQVDNTAYDAAHTDRFTLNGKTMVMETELQFKHYQTDMAAFLRLGVWFDLLREEGVYDNTRIILVSDHGRDLRHFPELVADLPYMSTNRESLLPLLMVKDFNAHGFTTSEAFMTNADVPTLATADLMENPVNPFTGKTISSAEKTAHPQFVPLNVEWDVSINCGNQFLPSYWASVSGNPWEAENWTFYDRTCALTRNAAP